MEGERGDSYGGIALSGKEEIGGGKRWFARMNQN